MENFVRYTAVAAATAAKSLQSCLTAAHQAPCPWDSPGQEYWSGLPFPSPIHESEK